ncbi:MAG: ABC transporter substrate-binding protein [Acetobacteraceae bacterium]|nr:ABC transporter substrate-binding protein [Acetobacteraceae bacterium]
MLGLLVGGAGAALLAACGGTAAPASSAPASSAAATSAKPAGSAAPSTASQTASAAAPASAAAKPSASAPASAAGSAAASPAVKSGGTLHVAEIGDLLNLEPQYQQKNNSEPVWMSYDRLTQYDLSLKPQPMLAESWDLTPDAKQITFHLRKGVTWHTGRDFTSDDVKYSLLRVRDPKVGSGQYTAQSKLFTTVDAPDQYTVVLKSDTPQPLMFDLWEMLNMVDQKTIEGPDAKNKSVGTGPFTFAEWIQGDHATFAKNKNYWQSGKPYLDQIVFTFPKDAVTMITQLEAGAVDVVRFPLVSDYARFKTNPKFQAIAHPAGGGAYIIGVNTTYPPLDNKLVRQALNYAVDRKRLVDTILNGVGTPEDLPWPEASPIYDASKNNTYTFDLNKAKALLQQAGVSNLSFDILPSQNEPSGKTFAEMYQGDLAQIGVKMNIVNLDQTVTTQMLLDRKYNGIYYNTQSQMQLNPGTVLNGAPIRPDSNNSGFKDVTYAQLVNTTTTETDPAKLQQAYSQINDLLLDQSFAIYLSPSVVTRIAAAKVHDMTPNMWGSWNYTQAWLDS